MDYRGFDSGRAQAICFLGVQPLFLSTTNGNVLRPSYSHVAFGAFSFRLILFHPQPPVSMMCLSDVCRDASSGGASSHAADLADVVDRWKLLFQRIKYRSTNSWPFRSRYTKVMTHALERLCVLPIHHLQMMRCFVLCWCRIDLSSQRHLKRASVASLRWRGLGDIAYAYGFRFTARLAKA